MAFSDDLITATSQLSVTDGAGGPAFAELLPAAGKAYVVGKLGVGAINPQNALHVAGASPALRIADGSEGDGRVLVSDASGNAAWRDNSRYFANNLPTTAIVATTAPQKIVDCLSFTKASAASAIEVHLNTRVDPGKPLPLVPGGRVSFQVRIDNAASLFANVVQVPASGADEFISIFAVFQSLAAGVHVVSVWAHTDVGVSGSVNLNPDGGGKVIVKETF